MRSRIEYNFQKPGLRMTGVENFIYWSEIGSGFGEPGGTLPPIFLKNSGLFLNPTYLDENGALPTQVNNW